MHYTVDFQENYFFLETCGAIAIVNKAWLSVSQPNILATKVDRKLILKRNFKNNFKIMSRLMSKSRPQECSRKLCIGILNFSAT